MNLLLRSAAIAFPVSLTADEALDFYQRWPEADKFALIMAANWRIQSEPGEEDWFEELTPDELDDEDFLRDFKSATIQLWMK